MTKKIIAILIMLTTCLASLPLLAQENLGEILAGKILLQVESHGEAWYINPADYKKYYLGRPNDAFALMQNLSLGITNENLTKIPVGIINYNDQDNDNDGLNNGLENALNTDPYKSDSDNDGYDDKTEIINNYDPLGEGKLNIDLDFTEQNLGKIFLQTEGSGEAWYLNPADKKRYFLSRPKDAFTIMRSLNLGITNENLSKIITGHFEKSTPGSTCTNCQATSADQVFVSAAEAIRQGDVTETLSYFTEKMQTVVEYTMNFLDDEGKFILGNIMSGATLSGSTDEEKIYSTEIYFSLGGYKIPLYFHVQKQTDDTWLLTNL